MLILGDGFIYIEIYEYFKKQIEEGQLQQDDKLPAKRSLARKYKVSLTSVENAYNKLLEEGYIYSKERSGYYVADTANLFLKSEMVNNTISKKLKKSKRKKKINNDDIICDFTKLGVDQENFCYKQLKRVMAKIVESDEILEPVNYQGHKPLREEIAKYLYVARGIEVSADEIVISSGIEYLMQILFRLIYGLYALEDPGYPMLRNVLEAYQIPYVPIPLDDGGLNLEYLFQSRANVCIVAPEHQFPTGIRMSQERRRAILNHKNIEYIIEDDYDSEFRYKGVPKPALKAIDDKDKVVYIGSISKALSPAFRLSYMVLPKQLLALYHKKFSSFGCPVSIIMQKIITELIKEGYFTQHINRMRKIYETKRNLIRELIAPVENLNIVGDDTGLHLVLECPKEYDEDDIVSKALDKNVLVRGLKSYGKKRNKPSLLLGFGELTLEEIKNGVDVLIKCLE